MIAHPRCSAVFVLQELGKRHAKLYLVTMLTRWNLLLTAKTVVKCYQLGVFKFGKKPC